MPRDTNAETNLSSNDERDSSGSGTARVQSPATGPSTGSPSLSNGAAASGSGDDKRFVTHERVGMGSFATVYRGEYFSNAEASVRRTVAVKVVKKAQLKRDKRILDNFESEMAIMKKMKHPHIVELFDVIQTVYDYNLVMEYCAIGDLSGVIRKRAKAIRHHSSIADMFTRFPSSEPGLHPNLVRHFLAQISSCLAFLRENELVHRDVKPQNLLLTSPAESDSDARRLGYVGDPTLPVLKLADFGFARVLPASSMAETLCGSPLYMAPEILNYEKYDAKADLWSVGAVAYEMVVGKPPFLASNHIELIRNIERNKDKIEFPFEVDGDLKNIICRLLVMDPLKRMGFTEFFELTNSHVEVAAKRREDSEASHRLRGDQISSDPARSTRDIEASSIEYKPTMYRAHLRHSRHSNSSNDIAVESPSPSPNSSDYEAASPRNTKTKDQEAEYVFIEKRNVEVNSLADDLQQPHSSRRHSANPETKGRRRRLSSILYGASPTNAMAQALLRSSARLFNTKAEPGKEASTKASMQSDEKSINDELEQLGTIGKVVTAFADFKFSQLVVGGGRSEEINVDEYREVAAHSPSSISTHSQNYMGSVNSLHSPRSPLTGGSFSFQSVKQPDMQSQMTVVSEALGLHLKALGVLGKAMQRLSSWWEARLAQSELKTVPTGINALVQWIRDKFNECVERAEVEKNMLTKLSDESGLPIPSVNVERLLFDRALELSRLAAEMEMSVGMNSNQSLQNSVSTTISNSTSTYVHSQGLFEYASQCQLNYGTALWLLKAFLEPERLEDTLSDDDHALVDALMMKIARRLESIRQRAGTSSTLSLNQTSSETIPSIMSDSGGVFRLDDVNANLNHGHELAEE